MFSKGMCRGLMAALIVMLFLAPAMAQAGGRDISRGGSKPAASRIQEQGGAFQALWHGLVGLFEKEGASIDPSGKPPANTWTSNTGADNGASIDPSGSH